MIEEISIKVYVKVGSLHCANILKLILIDAKECVKIFQNVIRVLSG
jgi:hypothetical protein